MLSKRVVEEVLGNAMHTGGDFAEIFFEDTINNSKVMEKKIKLVMKDLVP